MRLVAVVTFATLSAVLGSVSVTETAEAKAVLFDEDAAFIGVQRSKLPATL